MTLRGDNVYYDKIDHDNFNGKASVSWDGSNGSGKAKPGIYICKIKLNKEKENEERDCSGHFFS